MANVRLDPDVEQSLAQAFSRHGRIPVEVVPDRVEVETAAIDRQDGAPVVRNPFVAHPAARPTPAMRYGPLPRVGVSDAAIGSRSAQ